MAHHKALDVDELVASVGADEVAVEPAPVVAATVASSASPRRTQAMVALVRSLEPSPVPL